MRMNRNTSQDERDQRIEEVMHEVKSSSFLLIRIFSHSPLSSSPFSDSPSLFVVRLAEM